ncbi:hydrogenase maturation nickel metallochaperone HypA [Halorussus gelatinilyticus]|uniref:Hydrogenase maturation nickel metallochaperone HypA n=1 Tax=Halorussus gelatinilyticus TaxID=2937524 RepID=A0A8U0IGS9_9EURY|nr:hydrogenase maturation nickel metallochaperone HypA [Halorussus gelatinilyticus]UPV99890.1 hydrogenase maturation nickel metallochaperone HypA [Halorussus gelatinilyticus]
MAVSDSPPIGLRHLTVNPDPSGTTSPQDRSGTCECNDCSYTVETDDDLPPKCPDCDGALTFVRS